MPPTSISSLGVQAIVSLWPIPLTEVGAAADGLDGVDEGVDGRAVAVVGVARLVRGVVRSGPAVRGAVVVGPESCETTCTTPKTIPAISARTSRPTGTSTAGRSSDD